MGVLWTDPIGAMPKDPGASMAGGASVPGPGEGESPDSVVRLVGGQTDGPYDPLPARRYKGVGRLPRQPDPCTAAPLTVVRPAVFNPRGAGSFRWSPRVPTHLVEPAVSAGHHAVGGVRVGGMLAAVGRGFPRLPRRLLVLR